MTTHRGMSAGHVRYLYTLAGDFPLFLHFFVFVFFCCCVSEEPKCCWSFSGVAIHRQRIHTYLFPGAVCGEREYSPKKSVEHSPDELQQHFGTSPTDTQTEAGRQTDRPKCHRPQRALTAEGEGWKKWH